ncbi:hypothetical protein AGMMS50229_15780 [Campylobacterota bacterium]|nr:hypothetical protein AGMMS50229_15780 [Campylobacterota bacterium]
MRDLLFVVDRVGIGEKTSLTQAKRRAARKRRAPSAPNEWSVAGALLPQADKKDSGKKAKRYHNGKKGSTSAFV